MSKEQVAFKFHECPDGEEEDSRGNIMDITIYNKIICRTILNKKYTYQFTKLFHVFDFRSNDWYNDGKQLRRWR